MTFQQYQPIISCLQSCATACENCATLATRQVVGAEECIVACRDTAALCSLIAELMARESSLSNWLLPVCELACDSCADECELHREMLFGDCARQCRELHVVLDASA